MVPKFKVGDTVFRLFWDEEKYLHTVCYKVERIEIIYSTVGTSIEYTVRMAGRDPQDRFPLVCTVFDDCLSGSIDEAEERGRDLFADRLASFIEQNNKAKKEE